MQPEVSQGPANELRSKADRLRSLPLAHIALLAAGLLAFCFLCRLDGVWPGESQQQIHYHFEVGAIRCLHNEGLGGLDGRCEQVGAPGGWRFITAGSYYYVGNLLAYLPGLSVEAAAQLVQALSIASGLAGGYLLSRRLGAARAFALVGSFMFMISPSRMVMGQIVATHTAFTFLPMAIYLMVKAIDSLEAAKRRVLWLGLSFAANGYLVFMEGYGFMALFLFGVFLLLRHLFFSATSIATRFAQLAAMVTTMVVPVALYVAYVPKDGYDAKVPIRFFRSMGVDVATLVLPQNTWWAQKLNLTTDFRYGWGDGTANQGNFLGIIAIGLAIFVLVRSSKRSLERCLGVAGVAGLILSLGTSLKIYTFHKRDLSVEWSANRMPASAATAELPTKWLYENVAGFDDMRATYRWVLLTVFVLCVLAGPALTRLWKSKYQAIPVVLAVLAVIELMPDAGVIMRQRKGDAGAIEAWRAGPLTDLRTLTLPGERVFFLPADNDFTTNSLAPEAEVITYNVGADKAYLIARRGWPQSLKEAADQYWKTDHLRNTCRALKTDADVVILPYFSLHDAAVGWPMGDKDKLKLQEAAARFKADDRFVVVDSDWFASIRLTGQAKC